MKIKWLPLLLALSACSLAPMHARRDLVGMDRDSLIACAGVPDATQKLNNGEVLEYKQSQAVESPLDIKGPMSLELDIGGRGLCNAVFKLQDGKVVQLEYTGPSGTLLGPWTACEPLIKACQRETEDAKARSKEKQH